MFEQLKSAAKSVMGLFGDEEEAVEYEFSDDPQLDAENSKVLSQLRMLNAELGSMPYGGMSTAEYNAMLRKEGSGR